MKKTENKRDNRLIAAAVINIIALCAVMLYNTFCY